MDITLMNSLRNVPMVFWLSCRSSAKYSRIAFSSASVMVGGCSAARHDIPLSHTSQSLAGWGCR